MTVFGYTTGWDMIAFNLIPLTNCSNTTIGVSQSLTNAVNILSHIPTLGIAMTNLGLAPMTFCLFFFFFFFNQGCMILDLPLYGKGKQTGLGIESIVGKYAILLLLPPHCMDVLTKVRVSMCHMMGVVPLLMWSD